MPHFFKGLFRKFPHPAVTAVTSFATLSCCWHPCCLLTSLESLIFLVSSWPPCNSDAPAAGVHVVVGVPAIADFYFYGVLCVPSELSFIDIVTMLLMAYRMLPLTTATLHVVCLTVVQPLLSHVIRLKLWIMSFTAAIVYFSTCVYSTVYAKNV